MTDYKSETSLGLGVEKGLKKISLMPSELNFNIGASGSGLLLGGGAEANLKIDFSSLISNGKSSVSPNEQKSVSTDTKDDITKTNRN